MRAVIVSLILQQEIKIIIFIQFPVKFKGSSQSNSKNNEYKLKFVPSIANQTTVELISL